MAPQNGGRFVVLSWQITLWQGIQSLDFMIHNGRIIRYFNIIPCTILGHFVAHQVPLPTCLKFFVILTNEKAKVSYQTFIKELSNPPRIDTVVILQHIQQPIQQSLSLPVLPPDQNEGLDICTTIA